eukprot:SAG25_NODE_6696_length_537_cov_1.043379_1_plen_90_part_00
MLLLKFQVNDHGVVRAWARPPLVRARWRGTRTCSCSLRLLASSPWICASCAMRSSFSVATSDLHTRINQWGQFWGTDEADRTICKSIDG